MTWRDYESTDVAGAAYLARELEPRWPDRPSAADLALDDVAIAKGFEERAKARREDVAS